MTELPCPVLSYVLDPYDMLLALGRLLTDVGVLVTSFRNVRYHGVLEELMKGEFPERERHLYAKKEIVRLLNDTLFKEIIFSPGEQDEKGSAERFAAMGYHSFVLRYSTYCEGGAFPDLSKPVTVKERDLHPAPLNDIGAAMQLLCTHSDEWLVDTDRIAVCGFSAGGHNAAMYATRWQEKGFPRPAAAILGYALTDYVFKHDFEARQEGSVTMFFHASDTAFLGTADPTEEALEDVSPARHVTKDTPPTFLWATAAGGRTRKWAGSIPAAPTRPAT